MGQLLPALTTWSHSLAESGLVHKLVFDSYDREIERYGGLEGIEIAEQIFAADSLAVADLLALRLHRLTNLSPMDLTVLSIDDMLASLGLLASERLHLYRLIGGPRRNSEEHRTRTAEARLHKLFHDYRRMAQRLVGDRAWLLSQPGGALVAQCLQHRAEALGPFGRQLHTLADKALLGTSVESFLASCVHIHCVRLLGLNRPMEEEAIYYLERTLESLQRYVPEGIAIK
jgi:thiopeptide-type bacteriocin biosynthesis protein